MSSLCKSEHAHIKRWNLHFPVLASIFDNLSNCRVSIMGFKLTSYMKKKCMEF